MKMDLEKKINGLNNRWISKWMMKMSRKKFLRKIRKKGEGSLDLFNYLNKQFQKELIEVNKIIISKIKKEENYIYKEKIISIIQNNTPNEN